MGIEKRLQEAGRFNGYAEDGPSVQPLARDALSAIDTLKSKLAATEQSLAAARAEVEARDRRGEDLSKLVSAVVTWAEQRCPCENEVPDPCPLCGESVADGRCKAVDVTFPRSLLASLRAARTRGGSDAG